MKKVLKITFVLLFICLLTFFICKVTSNINNKTKVAENIKSIPNFLYLNIEGGTFGNKNLIVNKPVIFIYFSTECDFCKTEIEMIKTNILKFQNYQVIFVSLEKIEIIKEFAKKNQLTTYGNIYFLHDNQGNFSSTFDVKSFPGLVLYDRKHNLIEVVKGQIKAEAVIKKMNAEYKM